MLCQNHCQNVLNSINNTMKTEKNVGFSEVEKNTKVVYDKNGNYLYTEYKRKTDEEV